MPMTFAEYAAKRDLDYHVVEVAHTMVHMGWTQEIADSFLETFAEAVQMDEAGFLNTVGNWAKGIGSAMGSAWGAATAAQPENQLKGIVASVDKLAKTFGSLANYEQATQMITGQLKPMLDKLMPYAQKAQWDAKAQGAAGKNPHPAATPAVPGTPPAVSAPGAPPTAPAPTVTP